MTTRNSVLWTQQGSYTYGLTVAMIVFMPVQARWKFIMVTAGGREVSPHTKKLLAVSY